MRKVFLDDLPRKEGIGALKGKQVIDWKGSVGCKVRFIYDDVEGKIEIIDYGLKIGYITIGHKNKIIDIKPADFSKGKLGSLLNKYTRDFKIEIGQIFKDDKRDIIIIDRKYSREQCNPDKQGRVYYTNKKLYKYKCNKCGFDCGECYKQGKHLNEYWIPENTILKGHGCPVCSTPPMIVAPSINSIYNTAFWMIDLGVSEEDAKRYSKSSGEEIEVVCPICNTTKTTTINKIYNRGRISCVNCSDNIKYPEKFMSNILRELNIEFVQQLSMKNFKWIGDKRYDFYLPDYNMIIETHGRQHYEKAGGFYKTLEEEQENDRFKKELALNNGISNYIVIDCRKSELEWIKNSILNSELNEIFDLNNVDWEKIDLLSLSSNIIKEVCDCWNNKQEWETTRHLAKYFNLNQGVVISYLNKGASLNLCSYNPYEQTLKTAYNIAGHNKKTVEIFKDGISLGIFESTSELERQSEEVFGVKLLHGSISEVCNGKRKHHKGFTFKYVENN